MIMVLLFVLTACLVGGLSLVVYFAVSEEIKRRRELNLIRLVTPTWRGEWAERKMIPMLIGMGFDPRAIFHDLYVRKPNGSYTQVDLAVATKVGIIVFEIKDYGGWIFGNERQTYWTQLLAYGKEKHRFYNPIMQNAGHIQALGQNLLKNPDVPFYSVVVFFGRCELKDITYAPGRSCVVSSYFVRRAVSDILLNPPALYGDKNEVMEVLAQAVRNGNDPAIVCSQRQTVRNASRNAPPSTYKRSYAPFFRFSFFSWRRRRRWF